MEDWQCEVYLDLEYCSDGSFRCELPKDHEGPHKLLTGCETFGLSSTLDREYRKTVVYWE